MSEEAGRHDGAPLLIWTNSSAGHAAVRVLDLQKLHLHHEVLPCQLVVGIEEDHVARRRHYGYDPLRLLPPLHLELLPGVGIYVPGEPLPLHREKKVVAVFSTRSVIC